MRRTTISEEFSSAKFSSVMLGTVFAANRLFSLVNENFDTRLSIYGREALGSANIEMIDIARKHSSCAKFSGSGGAIFGMCLDDKKKAIFVFARWTEFEHWEGGGMKSTLLTCPAMQYFLPSTQTHLFNQGFIYSFGEEGMQLPY